MASILKEAKAGIPVKELCRKYSIGNFTFYQWCDQYSDIETSDSKRLKQREAENHKLEPMLAKLNLPSQL
ncbi:MAG: transposase [Snodgrassella sp.]|nr:transposase [Snodgrassella sp.]